MAFCKPIILVQEILQTIIFITIITRNFADNKNFENYGPYTIDYKEFKTCAGPKSKNLSHCDIELYKIKEDYMANISVTFFTQCSCDKVKIKVYRVEKNQKKILFNYNIDDACKHYAFASVIQMYFKANGCVVKKGVYNFSLYLNNVTRMFYGESAFYGEFQVKTIITSNEGNVWCCVINTIFNKAI